MRRAVVVAAPHASSGPCFVEVALAPGCGACNGCAGACHGSAKRWRVETSDASLRPGHELAVHIDEHALRRVAMTAYGAWSCGLLAGALTGAALAGLVLEPGQPHDWWVLAFAAAGTWTGWTWSQRRFRAAARRGEFLTIRIESNRIEEKDR